jgi:hypothetical protein
MDAVNEKWHTQVAVETRAEPEAIWKAFQDVASWTKWNAGIERIEIEGPFASGTWFSMKPPGQDALRSRFLEVRENQGFVDETRVGDLVVTVGHRIEPLGTGRTRVVYSVDAAGPGAAEVGPMVSSDFPEVLASLAKFVEQPAA